MWRLVLHSLIRRRWRSVAALFSVGLGVCLLLVLALVGVGAGRGLASARQFMGADLLAVPVRAPFDVEQAFFSGVPLNVYMDKRVADQARRLPGVTRVGAEFFTQTLQMECCGNIPEVRIVGVDETSAAFVPRPGPDSGRPLGADDVLVGAAIIDQVGWRGSRIELLGDIFRIASALEATGVGVDRSILMPIATARRLAAASEALRSSWVEAGPPDGLVSALLIEVADPARAEKIGRELERQAPVRVIRPAEAFRKLRQTVRAFSLVLLAGSLLPALAGAGYLVSHLASGAWDRKGEWALYRALGASRSQLASIVVGEALVLALGGLAAGLPLGSLLYWQAAVPLVGHLAIPFVAPSAVLWGAIVAGIVGVYLGLGIASALGPAWQVSRCEPARIMALGDIE